MRIITCKLDWLAPISHETQTANRARASFYVVYFDLTRGHLTRFLPTHTPEMNVAVLVPSDAHVSLTI